MNQLKLAQLIPNSTLAELEQYDFQVNIKTHGSVILEMFRAHSELPGVIVTDQGEIVAVLSQKIFLESMSKPYSLALYLNRPIKILLSKLKNQFLQLPYTCTIKQATQIALNRSAEIVYEPIVVIQANQQPRILDFQTLLCAQSQILSTVNLLLQEQQQKTQQYLKLLETQQIEIHQSQEKLRESEERYRNLVELAPEAIAVYHNGKLNYINPAGARLLGVASPQELIGKPLLDFVHPKHQEVVAALGELMYLQPQHQDLREAKLIRFDGQLIDVEIAGIPVTYSDKLALQLIIRDITELKRKEAALTESEQRYRELFQNHPYPMWVYDCETLCFLDVNNAAIQHYGYSRDEFLSMTIKDIRPPEDLPALLANVSQVTSGLDRAGIWRHYKKDSTIIYVEITSHAVTFAGRLAEVVSANDVTIRLQTQQALIQAEAKYRSIFENTVEGIFQTTPDGQYLSANPALARIYGYESPEIFISSISSIEQQLYVDPIRREEFVRLIEQQGAVSKFESQVYRQDGSRIWISENARAVRDASGIILYFEGTVEDITERKQAEEALIRAKVAEAAKRELEKEINERQQAEAKLSSSLATNHALLNAIPDWMFRISSSGIFINFKAAKDNHLPLPTEDFLGKSVYKVLPLEVAQPLMDCVVRALTINEIQICEYQLLLHEQLHAYEARLVKSAGEEVMAIVRDVTERKRAEAEIRQALAQAKELSLLKSRFVAMTSHEFRTPLTTILSSAELLQDYGNKWNEAKKLQHFQRIQTSVKHMTRLLNDVLLIGKADAGKLEFSPTLVDLTQFCRNLVDEIQGTATSHAIVFMSQTNTTHAYMDEKLLRQILSNLLSNALKYSPQGGTVNFDLIGEQEKVIFRIQDRGIGIPVADRAKLFDSFHRASNVGTISGTGLGLAIVKKAIDLHAGQITVASEVGVGTTFVVTLPLSSW